MVLSGVALGVGLAFLLGRALSRFLYEVSGSDLLSIGSASLVLLVVALVAFVCRRGAQVESIRLSLCGSVRTRKTCCDNPSRQT